jgi:multiple sugar transport system permease protein
LTRDQKNAATIKHVLFLIFRMFIIVGIGFIILYPIFLKLSVALRSSSDLVDNSIMYIPKNPTADVFKLALELLNFKESFWMSLLICTVSAILQVISCTMAGYSFGRFRFPLKSLLFVLVIVVFLVPPQVNSLPLYIMFYKLNLINNPVSLFLAYATANGIKSGLFIYLMMQYFKSIPAELEDAAMVDGAGLIGTMTKVILPNARTMMATVFLFTFVWQWTDTFYSTMFLSKYELLSINLGLLPNNMSMYIVNTLHIPGNPMLISQMANAGSILATIPLIIIYLFCNRFFVEGIEHSGLVE